MAHKALLKTTFEPSRVIQPIYTGGTVGLDRSGQILATCLAEEVLLTNLETGSNLARIEGDGEPITSLSISPDASYLITCSRSLSLRIFGLSYSGGRLDYKELRTLKPHNVPVVTTTVDSSSSLLATGSADGVVKVWDIRGGFTTHTFHGHSGIVSALNFFHIEPDHEPNHGKKSKRKTSISQEQSRLSLENGSTAGYRLASGGEDGKIRIWDMHKRKSIATLDGHVSVVRSLEFSPELGVLLSASRDRTAILWRARTWEQSSTIPILEVVESAGFLESGHFIYTGGESGRLRIWSTVTGQEVTTEQTPGSELEGILQIIHHQGLTFLLSIKADQTLLLHSLHSLSAVKSSSNIQIPPLSIIRRISGTHDEVIDLAYVGTKRENLALATNSEEVRIISLQTSPPGSGKAKGTYFGADVGLLKGHEDIVITMSTDWSGHWLATGAKDNTAKLWRLDPEGNEYTCYATLTGHAESIGAIALPNTIPAMESTEYLQPLEHPPKFIITGSQDKTVKRWNIGAGSTKSPRAMYTRKAHDKDINAISTSYSTSSTLFASASQDRTVKIWDAESGDALGVLRGHKRGVWSVAFAPSNMTALTQSESGGASSSKGMILTGSGDKSVRIWSLADYTCLRTFEGHSNSVLKVVWFPAPQQRSSIGVQVASAAGDGLVKVWDAQSGECAATLDNHIDRVWALAVKPTTSPKAKEEDQDMEGDSSETESLRGSQLEVVSGSADSTLTFWSDTTATTAEAATKQATQRVEQDQELQNHIRSNNYREAIVLALQLNHPKRLLDLFRAVNEGAHDDQSFTGRKEVDEVIGSLSDSQLWSLIKRIRDWNANGRTHDVAQHILYAVLHIIPKDRLVGLRRRRKNKPTVEADETLDTAMSSLSTKDNSPETMKEVLDGLKAYTEKHYQRLEKSADERFVLMWALQQMDSVGGGAIGGTANRHTSEDVAMSEGNI